MENILEKIADHWFSVLAGLLSSWLLLRQKFLKDEYNSMKNKIQHLEIQHQALATSLQNVENNQEDLKIVQTEIRTDIKKILANSSKKSWFR